MKINPLLNISTNKNKINATKNTRNYPKFIQKNQDYIKHPLAIGSLNINFTSVSTPQKKLIEICKSAKQENYCASKENMKYGIFQIDLHSHSNNSDGCASPEEILDQAAKYADKLYAKTGRKFTFALTDHDSVAGIQKALEYIDENKAKFKNINFIPGAELSFVFPSNNEVKSGEMLVYFIKPDSKETKMLVDRVRNNRQKMIDNLFVILGEGYSKKDLDGYFMHEGGTYSYNLHHRLRNYAQIKTRINKMAKEYGLSGDELYRDLMNRYVYGKRERVRKSDITPEGLDTFFKENHIYTHTPIIDKKTEEICHTFFPKITDGKVVSESENSFEYIIEVLKQNEEILIGFAHPYFTAKNMKNFEEEFENLLKIAKGRIIFSENYHQAYPKKFMDYDTENSFKDKVNEFLSSKGLIPIGGRDNHSPIFIEQIDQ